MAIRTGIDIGRLKGALRSPGMDTRMQSAIAEVVDVGYDADFGMFADVKVQPDLHTETCLVGSDFAGNDCGDWNPLKEGDIVGVLIPMGDPGYGPILFTRVWSASAKPPAEFHEEGAEDPTEPATDRIVVYSKGQKPRLVARDGATVSIEMSGGGDLTISCINGSNLNLTGDDTATINFPIVILGEGGAGIARIGDMVAISLPPLVAGVYPVTSVKPTGPTITAIGQIVSASSVSESS